MDETKRSLRNTKADRINILMDMNLSELNCIYDLLYLKFNQQDQNSSLCVFVINFAWLKGLNAHWLSNYRFLPFYSFLTKQFLPSLDCNLIFGFSRFSSPFFVRDSTAHSLFRIEISLSSAALHKASRFSASIINRFLKAVEFSFKLPFWFQSEVNGFGGVQRP